jgi:ankyrin repeat protein
LLQKGADINARSVSGQSVLMRATDQGNNDVVQFLIQNGADVNLTDNLGFGALTKAVVKDDLDTVKYFVKQGAKMDVESNNGVTPLMTAAYYGSSKVFSFLMEKGPDINKLTKVGHSALTYAAMGAGDTSKKFDPSIMKQLINAGASASIKDINGKSIIELAENETRYFENRKNRQLAENRKKSSQGMNQMAAANFSSMFDNLWSSVGVSSRVKEIKAILEAAKK